MTLRSSLTTVAVLSATLVAGCSRASSPVSPTPDRSTGSLAAESMAATPPVSAGVVSNTIIPIPPNAALFDPCTSEMVHVTGTIHLVTVLTADVAGGTHTEMHFNVQGVSGVGLTTGTRYRGIHTETHSTNTNGGVSSEFTTRIDIKLISEGASSNLTIRDALVHVTVSATGDVTATIDHLVLGACQ
jgi:hypothetical protein